MSEAFLPAAHPWLLIHSAVQFSQCSQGSTDCSLLPAPLGVPFTPWHLLCHLPFLWHWGSVTTGFSRGSSAIPYLGSLARLGTPGWTVCHYSPDGFSLKSPLLTPHFSDLCLPSPKGPGQGLPPCSSAQNQQEQGFSAVIFA